MNLEIVELKKINPNTNDYFLFNSTKYLAPWTNIIK